MRFILVILLVATSIFVGGNSFVIEWSSRRIPFPTKLSSVHNEEHNEESEFSTRRRNMILTTSAASILSQFLSSDSSFAAEGRDVAYFGPTIPFSSRRKYKYITLNNGLQVLLVSDKAAYRASAALCIEGAGQFAEPPSVPGLAHLLEHMTLSSTEALEGDFEDWLEDAEGASNAFTAPGSVCFHFNSPPDVFGEALERFSKLFEAEAVERICQNPVIVKREIRRVDAEPDYSSETTQAFYLLKDFINEDHPFARFGAGNEDTLEKSPKKKHIDVSTELLEFYRTHYLPSKAVLAVVCPADMFQLERWTTSLFSSILSRAQSAQDDVQQGIGRFPEAFPSRSRPTQIVLYRPRLDSFFTEKTEKLSIEWPMQLNYARDAEDEPIITAPAVGFIVSQILARRGPGSLYLFLLRRGWVPKGSQGLPKITFPVDVSGFQMMKLQICLTLEGFANRSAIVAAVYDSLRTVGRISQPEQSFLLPKALLNQYVNVARLHGYLLAPRPPDAVELAIDAQTYGLGGANGLAMPGVWPMFPSINDSSSMLELREAVADALKLMSNPTKGIVFITASPKAIQKSRRSIVDEILPPITSDRWLVEPVTGARYFREDRTKVPGYVEEWIAAKLDEDELLPPSSNPLVPAKLRASRPVLERKYRDGSRRLYYLDTPEATSTVADGYSRDAIWREFTTLAPDRQAEGIDSVRRTWEDRALNSMVGTDWELWQASFLSADLPRLPLPVLPPEPTCRCSFVLQLLSSRPARANVKQAAHSQLWLVSFERAVSDLAEFGAPAGLAYDIGFNKYGLRICFLGISQNLASYARRFCRRLVVHHNALLKGSDRLEPTVIDAAIANANRATSISPLRRRQIISVMRDATASEAAAEGYSLLKSCSRGICYAQGDLLPKEAIGLLNNLQDIFARSIASNTSQSPAVPSISEIVYKPNWRPRGASPCQIPGVPLISNACGRIQR